MFYTNFNGFVVSLHLAGEWPGDGPGDSVRDSPVDSLGNRRVDSRGKSPGGS